MKANSKLRRGWGRWTPRRLLSLTHVSAQESTSNRERSCWCCTRGKNQPTLRNVLPLRWSGYVFKPRGEKRFWSCFYTFVYHFKRPSLFLFLETRRNLLAGSFHGVFGDRTVDKFLQGWVDLAPNRPDDGVRGFCGRAIRKWKWLY